MGEKRSYKQYPKEFKEEAVGLVLEQGYIIPRKFPDFSPFSRTKAFYSSRLSREVCPCFSSHS